MLVSGIIVQDAGTDFPAGTLLSTLLGKRIKSS
jgi:hypothetical protein